MRLVLDTNVVASALLWDGVPRQLLLAAREKRIVLFTSMPLLAELTDIFGRSKFDKKIIASGFSIDQLVDRYGELTTIVRPIPTSGIAPDPDDDVVIGTALAAKADWIVTGDKPLLAVAMHQGVHIVSVSDAARTIAAG